MKILLKRLLVIIIVLASITLVFSFGIRKIALNSLSSLITNNIVADELTKSIRNSLPELNNSEINKISDRIVNSSELNSITGIYFDNVIDDILNNTNSNPNITAEIDNMLEESISGELTPYKEQIKSVILKIDFSDVYTNVLNYTKEIANNKLKDILTIYNILNSINTKIICSVMIIVSIALILVINKSLLNSLNSISAALTTCAIIQIIIMLGIRSILGFLDLTYIVIISMIELVTGTVLSIICNKVNKKCAIIK